MISRAQPDWAYEFSERTGPDTHICQTGLGFFVVNQNGFSFSQDARTSGEMDRKLHKIASIFNQGALFE